MRMGAETVKAGGFNSSPVEKPDGLPASGNEREGGCNGSVDARSCIEQRCGTSSLKPIYWRNFFNPFKS